MLEPNEPPPSMAKFMMFRARQEFNRAAGLLLEAKHAEALKAIELSRQCLSYQSAMNKQLDQANTDKGEVLHFDEALLLVKIEYIHGRIQLALEQPDGYKTLLNCLATINMIRLQISANEQIATTAAVFEEMLVFVTHLFYSPK